MKDRTFIDAIVADLGADEPRRVYADWLLSHNDPRGELIQLQCELARRGDPDDDDAPDAGAARKLTRRVRELLDAHRDAWLEPLRPLGFDDDDFTFVRGFPSALLVGPRSLHKATAEVHRLGPWIDELSVMIATEAQLETLATSPVLRSIRRLQLRTSKKRLGIGRLFPLPRLTALTLEDCALAGDDVRGLTAQDGLEELTISLCRLLKDALAPLGAAGCRLRGKLALPAAHAGSQLGTWLGSGVIDGVHTLLIQGNGIGPGGLADLMHADLRHVHELDLRGNELTGSDLKVLLDEKKLPKLTKLFLGGNALGDDGAARLAAWPGSTRLTKLHLGRTGLTNAGARSLSSSPELANLRSLVLSEMTFDAKTIAELLASPSLAQARIYAGAKFLKRG